MAQRARLLTEPTKVTAAPVNEFDDNGDSTFIRLTDQVTSFVGAGIIDGRRHGQTKALVQLNEFVKGAARVVNN